jgi:hypothetical protein
MVGGDLPTIDEFSLKLLTNKEVLECNQNGVMGSLIYEKDGIEIWRTSKKNSQDGWIGIFNRTSETKSISLKQEDLGLITGEAYIFQNVWNPGDLSNFDFALNPNGVVFLKYFLR